MKTLGILIFSTASVLTGGITIAAPNLFTAACTGVSLFFLYMFAISKQDVMAVKEKGDE